MEFLQSILDNTQTPFLYAFILGLMTAISPCPLATNITAIAFISKDIQNKNKIFIRGLIYTLGRAISYTSLGLLLFFGAETFEISSIFSKYGERILGPFLVIIGILMLDSIPVKFPSFNSLTDKFQARIKGSSNISALALGMVFALAFCPYSGVLFFGMLIPITISSASGLFLPLVFAIATGLPVILVAFLLSYSLSSIGNFYKNILTFQIWFNRLVSIVFIFVGIYYIYLFYIK